MKFAFVLVLAAFACCGTIQSAEPEPDLLNGVVARVNDSVITFKDIQTRMAPDIPFLERQYASQPKVLEQKLHDLQQKYLQQLVEEQLILHEFKTAGYSLPESFIQDRINDTIREYGDRLTLTKTLQAQGMTFESYKKKVREGIIIKEMWRHNVPADPVVSPHKIEVYYKDNQDKYQLQDQVKLRMIVLTNRPAEGFYSPKKMANEILLKIQEGAPFAEMAKIYSQGSQSVEGGDWGWVEKSVLRADLASKAFSLAPGKVSDVLEANDGCYLMCVEEAKAAHVKPIADVREEIESTLKAQEFNRLRKKYIDRLKSKAFVRYFTD